MAIMSRLLRLVKADVHGVMDQMEDKRLLLKQHLREMEEGLRQKEAAIKRLAAAFESLRQEQAACAEDIQKLENDIDTALRKGKDDIARFLLRKLHPLPGRRERLTPKIEARQQEIASQRQLLEQQRQQYEALKIRSAEYFEQLRQQETEQRLADGSAVVMDDLFPPSGVSPEEIEMELLRRKDRIGGLT